MAKNKKQFLVAGLGMFGGSVAHAFWEMGYDIMAVDDDEAIVQDFADKHPGSICYTTDAANEQCLRQLDLRDIDCAVVAVGKMESNMMSTMILKELGVPKVVVKAVNELHGKMLEKIGADKIIYAEKDMGERLAHNLVSNSIVDYIELSNEISVMSLQLPKNLLGKNLIEADLRGRYNINVVGIKRNGKTMINPNPKEVFLEGDEIIIIGPHDGVKQMGVEW